MISQKFHRPLARFEQMEWNGSAIPMSQDLVRVLDAEKSS